MSQMLDFYLLIQVRLNFQISSDFLVFAIVLGSYNQNFKHVKLNQGHIDHHTM